MDHEYIARPIQQVWNNNENLLQAITIAAQNQRSCIQTKAKNLRYNLVSRSN